MAVTQAVHRVVLLPFQEAESTRQQGWWQALGQGIEDFLTVERVRDAVVVLIAAGLYYWLAKRAKERLILTPMRVVVAQELTSIKRLRVDNNEDLKGAIKSLTESGADARTQEEAIFTGLVLKQDLAMAARLKELQGLTTSGLIAVATSVKGSLQPPALAHLEKSTLSEAEANDLRSALAVVSAAQAKSMFMGTRFALRRIRKSQSLGVAGLLLIVLLVVMFGNPALIAFGVLGAMVSRLVAFFRDSTDTDQKYNWVILFLVPIVGGLSAYGGVLLIDAMRTWGLLGDTFAGVDFGGEHANAPTMAAAFLFGFVERLLDNVAGNAVDGLGAVAKRESEADAAGAAATGAGGGSAIEIQRTHDDDDPGPDGSGAGGAQNVGAAVAATIPGAATQTTTATPPPPEGDDPIEMLDQDLSHEDPDSEPNR